jgi:Ca2+-binding EF-hand superfamily protein
VRALSEIFDRLDHDNDGYLHRAEVEQYLQRCAGNETGLYGSVVVKVLLQRFSKREGACLRVRTCCCFFSSSV